jgi:AraC family transcriptional regulator
MSNSKASNFAKRFNRVFDFIDRHLGEPLSLDQLSRVAHVSRFHFHRQFAAYTGVPLGRYLQLARLRRASYRLVFNPLDRITDIALDCGYEQAESFSRVFKSELGVTPSAFRLKPDWLAWSRLFQSVAPKRIQPMQVKIVKVEPVTVAVLEHRGDPRLVNDSAQKFIAWRKESGLSPIASSKTYGIAYDDPATTRADAFRFDICGEVSSPVPANRFGIVTKTIPGGRCAVVRHEGSPDDMSPSVYYLYREWLPRSGEALRDFPLYFHYVNLRQNTPEHELLTDVYLPIR